jgi:UDP-glucose 4-epimerase
MSDTVLITGGFGYLGGRIAVSVAHEARWKVRLTSRHCPSPPVWLSKSETVSLDLLRPETVEPAMRGVKAIVHLAALNESESLADPQKALLVNTLGSLHLLEAAIRAGVERFIYFSTAHVYGSPLTGHITEHSIPRPIHPYAITHHSAEEFVLAAQEKGSLLGIVIRLSNGFGAPTHAGVNCWMLLINDLCMQAVRDKKLVLRSSGSQQRDFVTLHDVGGVVCHFLELPHTDCADGLFNMGGECSMTAWVMAQRIIKCCREILGYEPEVVRPEPSSNEVELDLRYDISKLKKTGFLLSGNMDEEIRQTLKMCVSMQWGQKA